MHARVHARTHARMHARFCTELRHERRNTSASTSANGRLVSAQRATCAQPRKCVHQHATRTTHIAQPA
eukprot:4834841-Alexandrium_andersonii.AAC.1